MKIVLYPGHGGRDPGAIGVPLADPPDGMEPNERLQEKDVTLNVSLLAAAALRELGYTVLLTRDADVNVPLHERTGLALAEQVDAYISIHANMPVAERAARSGTRMVTNLLGHLPQRWKRAFTIWNWCRIGD